MASVHLSIRRLSSTGEWKVVVRVDKKLSESDSYYGDSWEDAHDTALAMARRFRDLGGITVTMSPSVRSRSARTSNGRDSMAGVQVYDNGGKTFDRYTINIDGSVYGSSHNPFWPQGFWQYAGEAFELPHWRQGRKISVRSLPEEVQRAIKQAQRREPNPNTKEDYEDAESLDRKLQYKREKDYEAAALLRYSKRLLADAERESKQAQRREPNPAHSRRQARKIGVLMRRGIIKKRGRRTKNPQSFAALLRRYDRNEDRNFHSENYLLLAKAYGTPEQVREVERILRLNRKLGHSDDAGRKWMYENINHYFKRLLADAERESKTPRRTKNFAHGMRYIRYMPQGSTRRTGNPRRRLGARRGDLGLLLSRPVKQILRVLYQRGYLADGTRAKMTAEARRVLLKLQRRGLVKHVGRVGKNARWTLTTAGWRVAG